MGAGFFVQAVLAVHELDFELDGNATSAGRADWDEVYADHLNGTLLSGAEAVTWASDDLLNDGPSLQATIFTGGGSKDPQNINQWAWKDGAGGLPDKDNLLHSFAARYSYTPSTTCPAGTEATCEVLYFGSDRFDNSGDAHQAFWFLQNKVTLNSVPRGGGFGFTGLHKLGDLLVVSNFSNGGATSTITVFSWDPACLGANKPNASCADANLKLEASAVNAKCDPALTNDSFCGIVNPGPGLTTSHWDFLDKSGNANYLNGEFFEGGVNLSALGFGDECFSSFLAETRSSTSTTATLKDFVLGQFAVCDATISTTPSATLVTPGTGVTDTATVTGSGGSNPPAPTGSVTFFVCGPTASPALCTTGGTEVGSVALSATNPATATSAAVNAGTPLSPGRYCFRAEWPGDSNYTNGPYVHTGVGESECFVVQSIATTTVTTPSDGSGNPLNPVVALGTDLFDRAVVTNTSLTITGAPTGSVEFFVCNPSQVSGAPGAEVCASPNGTAVGSPIALVAINAIQAAALSSPAVDANTAGVWCFRADYTPTGTVFTGSSDASHNECVTVVSTSLSSAQDWLPNDSATLTASAGGGNLQGTLSFTLYSGSTCSGSVLRSAQNFTINEASPVSRNTDNTTVKVSATAIVSWKVVFTPDDPTKQPAANHCETTSLTINNN